MKGDFHVRFCENPRVKLPWVTRLWPMLLGQMRLLITILTFVTSVSLGQSEKVECLDSPDKFELFNRHIKYSTPEQVKPTDNFLADTIYLQVDLTKSVKYDYLIKGIQVLIINTTDKELTFSDDGVLELFCQAKNNNGDWVDIEGRKMPWNCWGKTLTLDKQSYYKAVVPCYNGGIQTEMRYRFTVSGKEYFSDKFVGTINEGQIKD
jgi:hypothetical protein